MQSGITKRFTMTLFFKSLLFSLLILLTTSPLLPAAEYGNSWEKTVNEARGKTVNWYMWGGSPSVNKLVNGFFADQLKKKYDITLRQVPVKDIAEVVSKLLVEKQAGKKSGGNVDLMWINGENFRTCKSNALLYGPFADSLPNIRFVNRAAPTIASDFGTPVDGMESPWGSAQMVMIYDTERTPNPPRTIPALIEWIRSHPGRFAYPAPPDFTGSVFIRHFFYASTPAGPDKWQGSYTENELQQAEEATYRQLLELKPYLWRKGTTYPESPVRMDSLFSDGQIDFSFSYHQAAASRNILDGIFAKTVRTYVFDEGTIANTHFVAIPFNAASKAAAKVVANYLLSPEAQLKKADPDVWGDFPIISPNLLPAKWQEKFKNRPRGEATLTDAELQAHQLPEPPSNILVRLEKGWVKHVLKGR